MAQVFSFGEAAGKRANERAAISALAEQARIEFESNAESVRALMNAGPVQVSIKTPEGKLGIFGRVMSVAPDNKSMEVQLRSGAIVTATGDHFGGMVIATLTREQGSTTPPPPPPPLG